MDFRNGLHRLTAYSTKTRYATEVLVILHQSMLKNPGEENQQVILFSRRLFARTASII